MTQPFLKILNGTFLGHPVYVMIALILFTANKYQHYGKEYKQY